MARVRPLIIGNWKMNPATVSQAGRVARGVAEALKGLTGEATVVVAPPTAFLTEVAESGAGRFLLGAQSVSPEEGGAYTGGTSVSMLRSLRVSHVIVGHSELRAKGLTDTEIARILEATVKGKLVGVLCVGECERDAQGQYFGIIENQLTSALAHIAQQDQSRVVIAYEPIWAIGTGVNATAGDIHEMQLFIQKVVADLWDRETATRVPILYGGSVSGDNAAELLKEGGVRGFLVGGASLRPREFSTIVKHAEHYARFA